MARVFTILLTLVYAFSATGATVHLHYCCGTAQKIVLQHDVPTDHADCPLCVKLHDTTESQSCCTSESCDHDATASDSQCGNVKVELKKTTEEHITSADKNNLPKIYPLELIVCTIVNLLYTPADNHAPVHASHSDLSLSAVPLFIQHCTYRI